MKFLQFQSSFFWLETKKQEEGVVVKTDAFHLISM